MEILLLASVRLARPCARTVGKFGERPGAAAPEGDQDKRSARYVRTDRWDCASWRLVSWTAWQFSVYARPKNKEKLPQVSRREIHDSLRSLPRQEIACRRRVRDRNTISARKDGTRSLGTACEGSLRGERARCASWDHLRSGVDLRVLVTGCWGSSPGPLRQCDASRLPEGVEPRWFLPRRCLRSG